MKQDEPSANDRVKELVIQQAALNVTLNQLEKSLVSTQELVEKWEPVLADWRSQAKTAMGLDIVSLNDISNIKKNISNVKQYITLQKSKVFSKTNEINTLRAEMMRIEKDLSYWENIAGKSGELLEFIREETT